MSKTILLADDSVTIQKVVELTFMDGDYDVVAVSNGDDAGASLEQGLPDLVIADVHMPGADGYEVCRRVKEVDPTVPVLLLVGTFEPFDPDEMEASGADAHLKKPFDSQELLRLVEDLAARGGRAALAAAEPPEEAEEAEPLEAGAGELVESDARVPVPEEQAPPAFELPEELTGELAAAEVEEEPPAAEESEAEESEEEIGAPDLSPWAEFERRLGTEEEAVEAPPGAAEPIAAPGAEPTVEEPAVEEPAVEEPAAEEPFTEEPAETPEEPAREVEREAPPAAPAAAAAEAAAAGLSDADVDRVAQRVVELLTGNGALDELGERVVREVTWEVVPDLAEVIIKGRLRELERELDESDGSAGAAAD